MNFVESKLTNDVKVFVKRELKGEISKNLEEKIELFDKYLCLSKDGSSYDGLNTSVSSALSNLVSGGSPWESLKLLSVTEQYLKSLVFLFNKAEYDELTGQGQDFRNIIIFLGMTKLNMNGNLNLLLTPNDINRGMTLEIKYINDRNQYHWARAYSFRNNVSHNDYEYSDTEVFIIIRSILYVMLESTWKYKDDVESKYIDELIFDGINKKGYFDNIIRKYEDENLQKTFIVMSVVNEDFRRSWSFKDEDDDKKSNLISSLDIMGASDDNINFKKLVGQAGLGKSRLMRYLQYIDAKEGRTYPVYVELRELSDLRKPLLELIGEKAGLDIEACDLLMKKGGMSLYLDGINEILSSENDKRIMCANIKDLGMAYPKTKILVSDRENSLITVRDIPTYLLEKLNKPLIDEFLLKNCKSKEIENNIKEILREETYLYDLIRTPFMLEVFINLVENNEYNTNLRSERKLRAKFVESLIRREAEEKHEGRASKITRLLSFLFIKNQDLEEDTYLFTENQVLVRFRKCMEYFGFQEDSTEILELIVQMGILKKLNDDENYAFANEIYEKHFKDQAFDILLEID